MITVANLSQADRPVWEELFRGYNAFYGREMTQAVADRAWAEFSSGERMHALGAYLDGELVGITHFLVHASTTTADVCYLQDLFTAPAARGKGAGRALIEAVAQWARDQGCAKVYWTTKTDNTTARALYDQVATHEGFIVYRLAL